jgi:hypothetical protein
MNVLEDFFSNESNYIMKRMELLRFSPTERKHKILARFNINELAPKKIRVGTLSELLFFYDDSLWGNAKGGMLITNKALFFLKYGDDQLHYLDWNEIEGFDNVYIESWNEIFVQFKGGDIGLIGARIFADSEKAQFLDDLIRRLFKHKHKVQKTEEAKNRKLEEEKKKKAELAQKKKQLEEERKRKAELEQKKKLDAEKKKQLLAEQKKKEALALEKKKKAEQIHIEKNSYFYEVEKNNTKSIRGPFTKQEMDDLLAKNEITLTTKIKFGLHIKTLKELRTFPEFTLGLEDFL